MKEFSCVYSGIRIINSHSLVREMRCTVERVHRSALSSLPYHLCLICPPSLIPPYGMYSSDGHSPSPVLEN